VALASRHTGVVFAHAAGAHMHKPAIATAITQ
jgi:hypothetical protein